MRIHPALPKLALLVLSPLVFFVVLELVGLALGVDVRAEDDAYDGVYNTRLCRFSADAYERSCNAQKVHERMRKRSIFVFGGSSVEGYPKGVTVPFASYLQANLDAVSPGLYSVHNFGRQCKDSYFVKRCLTKVIELEPDVIVIYSGHNDFGLFVSERPALAYLQQTQPWLIDVEHAAAKTRTYSLALSLLGLVGGQPNRPNYRIPDPAYDSSRKLALTHFTSNIEEVLGDAEDRGIPIVLMTLVSNLHEHPRKQSMWRMAGAYWKKVSGPHGEKWHDHHVKAMTLFNEGDKTAALAEFKLARDELMDSRAPTEANAFLRARAAQDPAVHLVDIEAKLDAIGVEEGIGCNFFGTEDWCDQFHPNPRLQRMMGEILTLEVLSILGSDAS